MNDPNSFANRVDTVLKLALNLDKEAKYEEFDIPVEDEPKKEEEVKLDDESKKEEDKKEEPKKEEEDKKLDL